MKKFLIAATVLQLALGAAAPAFAARANTGADTEDKASAAPGPSDERSRRDLTIEELEILQHGEIGTGSLIGGGLLGTFVGFGTGHIVYGQYSNKGWIFTLGELSSLAVAAAGGISAAFGCFSGSNSSCGGGLGLLIGGYVAFFGFRVWEVIDVWTLPGSYNDRYRAIKAYSDQKRAGGGGPGMVLLPFVLNAPPGTSGPPGGGMLVSFRF